VPQLCVHQLFEQQVARTPEAVALEFGDQELSYGELNARANCLAHHLIGLGVGPDVIVAVCLERSIELIVGLLAILKAGGAYLPLDPAWPAERLGLLLRQARPALMLTNGDRTLPVASDLTISLLRLDDPSLKAEYQPQQALDFRDHSVRQLAYLTYTSGSTGRPKGVLIEHRGILRLLDPTNPYAVSIGDRVLQLAPLAFDAATFEIWGSLLKGATLVLAPPWQLTLQELAALLSQQRVSTLWLTAGLFQAMVEEQPEALAGVRQILAGGDVLAPGAVQQLLDRLPAGHQLINGYGPTENTTFTCCHRLAAGEVVDPGGLPIGRPIAATLVRVLDRVGQSCPINVPGELHICGTGLARGYLNNPELTAETFIADPFAPDPTARLYRSGDLVSWNADGSIAFHGRIDQQIKLRGFRIEPGEIEAALLDHPAVAQAVVVLHKDDPANPRLIAYMVPQTPGPSGAAAVSADQLRAFLAERLPDYMVPAAFVELEALPLTTNGKLDRKALPSPSFSGDGQQRVAPSTDLERQLHAIWAEVLGHGEFGTSDNFFSIGGHSLAAARLVSRIEENLGQRLPLASLFQSSTLAALASRLTDGVIDDHRSFRSLVIVQGQGESSPLFVVHGGGGDVFIHVHLARCLAPRRPVYGLQAVGIDGSEARHRTVEEMASHYASEILRLRPQGPIHLLGYSGGGWYAWAVAAEILRRGGCLGLIGLVDTRGTADLHRRLRLQQLLLNGTQQLLRQLSHWRDSPSLPQRNSLRRKLEAFRFHSWTLFRTPGGIAPNALDPDAMPRPTQPLGGDYFIQLHTYYRPPRLPVRADIFSTPSAENNQRKLWNFYATGEAYLHPALLDHNDYYSADFMPAFAERLDALINDIESQQP
jgi:amino acid adenylation domain-containing protein